MIMNRLHPDYEPSFEVLAAGYNNFSGAKIHIMTLEEKQERFVSIKADDSGLTIEHNDKELTYNWDELITLVQQQGKAV